MKKLRFSRCNEGTIVDGAVNNPNPNDCHVIETISVYKFQQVQGSLQLARKVALDQVAYENEDRGAKSLKIQTCQCNEGTIDDGPVKNPNLAGCNVIEPIYQGIEISARSRLTAARKKGCTRSSSI